MEVRIKFSLFGVETKEREVEGCYFLPNSFPPKVEGMTQKKTCIMHPSYFPSLLPNTKGEKTGFPSSTFPS